MSLAGALGHLKVEVDGSCQEKCFYLTFREGQCSSPFRLEPFRLLVVDQSSYKRFASWLPHRPEHPRKGDLAYNAEAAVSRIREWTRACTLRHSSCESGGFAPSRLLFLDNRWGHETIRLIETWPGSSSPYVALSHC